MKTAQQLVHFFQDLGMTDRSIGIMVGRGRETICKIGNGQLDGSRTYARLLKLYRAYCNIQEE